MGVALSNEVGAEIAKILGIQRARHIDLSFHLNEPVKATVTFLPEESQVEAVVHLLQKIEWEPKPQPQEREV